MKYGFFHITALSTILVVGCVQHLSAQNTKTNDESEAEREAVRFINRLNEAEDITPLIDEFFIPNFVVHGRAYIRDAIRVEKPKNETFREWGVERDLVLSLSLHDLRRAYIAGMNLYNLGDLLDDEITTYIATSHGFTDSSQIPSDLRKELFLKVVPPELFKITERDPLCTILISSFANYYSYDLDPYREINEKEQARRIRAARLRTLPQFRAFITKIESAVVLVRAALQNVRQLQKETGKIAPLARIPDRYCGYIYKSFSHFKSARGGLPINTRLYFVRIFPFEILLTSYSGAIKILAVYPDIDGD